MRGAGAVTLKASPWRCPWWSNRGQTGAGSRRIVSKACVLILAAARSPGSLGSCLHSGSSEARGEQEERERPRGTHRRAHAHVCTRAQTHTHTHTSLHRTRLYERRCSTCIYYPHLIDEETDAQAEKVTFPQSFRTVLGLHRGETQDVKAKKQWDPGEL